MIEKTVHDLLATITDNKYTIQPGILKTGVKYPAISYTVISSPTPERTSTRQAHSTKATTMQIDVWAKTYLEALNVSAAVLALDGVTTEDISLIEVDDVRPSFDNPSELHHRSIDLTITHAWEGQS